MGQADPEAGYLVKLDQASYKLIGQVGGKAASLGEMLAAGINVPGGFVITTKAYKTNDIDQLLPEIEALFDELGMKRVAVRSSAVGEDAGDASWAGQLETVLNVTRDGLKEAIQYCWQSMQADRAQAYAKDNQITKDQQAVAVVVQKMVDSDVSGVMFTANPITSNVNQMVIEAIYGLGELLVQGSVTPESLIIEGGKVLERTEHRQTKQLVYQGGQNQEVALESPGEILTSKQIDQLIEQGKRIEQYYGRPQDIEFAFEADQLFVVQSRPITTLNKKDK